MYVSIEKNSVDKGHAIIVADLSDQKIIGELSACRFILKRELKTGTRYLNVDGQWKENEEILKSECDVDNKNNKVSFYVGPKLVNALLDENFDKYQDCKFHIVFQDGTRYPKTDKAPLLNIGELVFLTTPEPESVITDPGALITDPDPGDLITDPEPGALITDPEPEHVITDPEPEHVITDPEHEHVITDPEHEHVITDPEPDNNNGTGAYTPPENGSGDRPGVDKYGSGDRRKGKYVLGLLLVVLVLLTGKCLMRSLDPYLSTSSIDKTTSTTSFTPESLTKEAGIMISENKSIDALERLISPYKGLPAYDVPLYDIYFYLAENGRDEYYLDCADLVNPALSLSDAALDHSYKIQSNADSSFLFYNRVIYSEKTKPEDKAKATENQNLLINWIMTKPAADTILKTIIEQHAKTEEQKQ
jgi:hypothetical protein